MNAESVDVRPIDLAIIWQILRSVLPPKAVVWVFGSRAKRTARAFSDLDLVVDAGRPLTHGETTQLSIQFEESSLPYTVDVVDWRAVSASFREAIEQDRVLLPQETAPAAFDSRNPSVVDL